MTFLSEKITSHLQPAVKYPLEKKPYKDGSILIEDISLHTRVATVYIQGAFTKT